MAYTKNPTWVDGEGGGTRIDASKLNAIEDGIFNSAATADGAVPKSLADAKGDLLVGSANDTIVRKAVGTDGQILMADSNATDGLTWQAPIPLLKNLLANSDFAGGTGSWTGTANAGFAVAAGVGSITATAQGESVYQAVTLTAGRRYYIAASVTVATTGTTSVTFGFAAGAGTAVATASETTAQLLTSVQVATATGAANLAVTDGRASAWTKVSIDNVVCIDLTAAFGAGLEPSKEEMDKYLSRYTNSWFADTTPQLWSGADWLKRTQNACENLGRNGDFSNGTSQWSAKAGASISAASNELTMIATAAGGYVYQIPTGGTIPGSTYYIAATVKATTATPTILLALAGTGATHTGGGAYERLSFTKTASATTHAISVVDNSPSGWGNVLVKWVVVIDLTKTFGAGNEPTKSEMDYLLSLYPNNWFGGTVNDLVTRRNIRDRIGSGSPEGVVTAKVGTGWTDILATFGAVKWLKASGDNTNTGWIVSVGDTGWRDVSASLAAGYLTSNPNAKLYVRRTATTVWWSHYTGASNTASGVVNIFTIPAGLKASITALGVGHGSVESSKAASTTTLYPSSATALTINTVSGTPTRESLRYPAVDAAPWPTALPGSAVAN